MHEKLKIQALKEIEELKVSEGWLMAGKPKYEGLFGRDSLISSWQLLRWNPEIARSTLGILAKYQGKKEDITTGEEPGKILHEFYPLDTPDEWWNKYKAKYNWLERGKPVYMSHDSTPLFVFMAWKYFEQTRDVEFIKKILPNLEKAVEWMIEDGGLDKYGFLSYENKSGRGLIHQGWKDGTLDVLGISQPVAMVEIQGYAYSSLIAATKIADVVGKKEQVGFYANLAEKLKRRFNEAFWMPKEKFFCLALDGKGRQRKAITSNPGHLLFTGIIDAENAEAIVGRLFKKDIWTIWGLRTHSQNEKDFNPFSYHLGTIWPHDGWIFAQGLRVMGFTDEYEKVKRTAISTAEKLGCLPEFYGVIGNQLITKTEKKACYPQAWSSAALLDFLNEI